MGGGGGAGGSRSGEKKRVNGRSEKVNIQYSGEFEYGFSCYTEDECLVAGRKDACTALIELTFRKTGTNDFRPWSNEKEGHGTSKRVLSAMGRVSGRGGSRKGLTR